MIKAALIGSVLGLLMLVFIHPYVMGRNGLNLVTTLWMMLAVGVAPLVFVSLLAPNIRKKLSQDGTKLPYLLALSVGCFGTIGVVHLAVVMVGH